MKEKFDIIQSTCLPIAIDNCNTDLIIPARYMASTTRDPRFFGDAFMHDLRYDADGKPVAEFVLNRPGFCEAQGREFAKSSLVVRTGVQALQGNMQHGLLQDTE